MVKLSTSSETTRELYHTEHMVNRDMEETSSKTFSVFLQNIRSLPRNFEEFELEIEQLAQRPDIICLTETWLQKNSDNDIFQIQGDKPLYSCARIKRGGVIGIYVNTGSDPRIIKQKKR